MKGSHILSTLIAAGGLAAVISFYLNPKLEDEATQAPNANVSAMTVEKPDPALAGRRSATITAKDDGHYWTRALVNRKASIEFMVDTGASVIALTQADARKMGLKPERLEYKWEIRTAGGITKGASVIIDSIKINQVHIKNVEAMVLDSDLEQSLLGMSFLRELYSYEVRGDRMIIRQ